MKFLFFSQGFHILHSKTASQQAHPAAVHGQPRVALAPPQDRHLRGSADEGQGQRGEATQKDGQVRGRGGL